MNIFIIAAAILLSFSTALRADPPNIPAFTNLQYYVFATESIASNALAEIDSKAGVYPFKGKNQKTKKIESGKASTVSWGKVTQRLDGKFIFRRIPPAKLIKHGTTPEEKMAWLLKYNPSIELYRDDWFAEDPQP